MKMKEIVKVHKYQENDEVSHIRILQQENENHLYAEANRFNHFTSGTSRFPLFTILVINEKQLPQPETQCKYNP